ncbi:hypothetical protein MEQU1_003229 [Malassezia equina]|uniref:Glucose-methanol-choline oxidoreductase N-terminal domain-containing protein n=1 Tax=Malassezia equina TaxID=1381935 RepID=A0AAF0ELV2_9BASI|nr:hypothetical protein MEQU1_003229 [Malassezia equina]
MAGLLHQIVALCAAFFWALHSAQAAHIHYSVNEVQNTTWDYIVVGGGLTGLVVSRRLAEEAGKKVLVIEPGMDERKNEDVYKVSKYGAAFDTKLDWAFETKPQAVIEGRTRKIRAGRLLGGSTGINGAAWNRAARAQYDSLGEIVGDHHFNFTILQSYMNRAESFVPPNHKQKEAGADFVSSAHGWDGPLSIGFSPIKHAKRMFTGPAPHAFTEAMAAVLHAPKLADQCDGNNTGVAFTPTSISQQGIRQASYMYLEGTGDNLHILLGNRVRRLLWNDGQPRSATAVQVQAAPDAGIYVLHAQDEIILAAGALNTPGILERSGVGAKDVLDKARIRQVINLPGVGKNLQEQTMNTMGLKADVNYTGGGPSNTIANTNIYQLFSNATQMRKYMYNHLDEWANLLQSQGHVVHASTLQQHWKHVMHAFLDQGAPVTEHFFDTGYPANSYGIDTWFLLPFSRGSVHVTSSNVFASPSLDPNYFAVPIDMDFQVASMRANRRLFAHMSKQPGFTHGEHVPGMELVPENDNNYGAWRAWILGLENKGDGFGTVSHPIGTCSMMPHADGGVVGPRFTLYGTTNVRIVDASILPVQISAHLSSTLYGLAEYAADMIRDRV